MAKYDWSKIKAEYIHQDITLEELAKKYNRSFSTLMKRSAKEKWNEERKIYSRKLEEKKQEKMSDILASE